MPRPTFLGADLPANPASFAAIATSVADTVLWTPTLWTPIPARDMRAGNRYELSAGGIISNTATPTTLWTPRIGSGVVGDATLGPSTVVASPTGLTNAPWFLHFELNVRQIGVAAAGSTVTGNGFVVIGGGAAAASQVLAIGGGVPTTVDHTIERYLHVTFQWGTSSASNTITCQWVNLRSANN